MIITFKKFRTLFLVSLLVIIAVQLSACSKDEQWGTKNISGLMPPLKFTMTESNHDQLVHGDNYLGHVVLLYFGYTHCPDVCPLTLGRIKSALAHMGAAAKAVQVLFVSVDPSRDTVGILKSYTQFFGPQFVGLFANQPELRALTKRYRVTYGYDKPDEDGNYNVSHSSAVYAFDKKGKARLLIRPRDKVTTISTDLKRLVDHS